MAEREGFEPSVPFRAHTLSKRAPSATRTSLHERGCKSRKIMGNIQEFDVLMCKYADLLMINYAQNVV
jgi:hypothetical protein